MNAFAIQLFCDAAIYFGIGFGLWISLRILAYPDLSIEQLFVLGGVLFSFCVPHPRMLLLLPLLLLLLSFFLGFICSAIRNKFRIHAILVSLIASYAYYSIALVLLGAPNVYFGDRINLVSPFVVGIVSATIYGLMVLLLALFAKTPYGLKIIASGSNISLAERHRLNPFFWQSVGLGIAFSFVSFSGALFAWRVGYVDVGSGSGLLLIGIFVVLVTRAAQARIKLLFNSISIFAAMVCYLGFFQMAIEIGMRPQWLRGMTAASLLIILLFLPRKKGKFIAF